MQVLKRIVLFFLVIGLFGCNSRLTSNRIEISDQQYDIIDYDTVEKVMIEEGKLNVAVILPLTGKAGSIGAGMQNAMFLASDDFKNNKVVLKFYDTKSTKSGATLSAEKAISEGADLILGPLMSEEVEGVATVALSADVPVVSFTTSPQVLQKGIYSIGLLNGEQIDRAITYASEKGRKNIALLVPDNNSGLNIAKSALMSSLDKDISLVKIGFYNQNTVDFSSIIKEISTPLDFDTVLIADGGNRLKSLASMFAAHNNVLYPEVLFLGTSAWEGTNLSKETTLHHGAYPMMSKGYSEYFSNKYKNTFGEQPKPIYSFAYDSVLLASTIAAKDQKNIEDVITGKNGFIGVNGFFKILPTGASIHSLDMLEVTAEGPKIISNKASKSNYTESEFDIRYVPYEKLPKIYGKNSSDVLGWMYNN